ncbi:hypothetical protein CMO88_04705 [Candidatus Woesearchaeota archaeon]|nr:hypothetical protein [Candidatus Woesearchaeota archaeon]|tara:strand:- start:6830 stop:8152 length:1323 start_codon:yes stop_codon:yes gene_type:complete
MAIKSTLGLEIEFMLVNKNGQIVNNADKIIEKSKKKAPKAFIIPEIAENMLEIGSDPSEKVSVSSQSLLDNINLSVKAASEEKTLLLPTATYPGEFIPKMRDKGLYKIKKKLFAEKFDITGKCVGFHLHHALPQGSFDATSKNLKAVLSKKTKKSLVEAYNLSIALDPVLTTFMQSSPFYDGKHLGKDSRMIVYRGGKILNYEKGLYSEHLQEFGELPPYKFNESDLLDMVVERYSVWKKIIRQLSPESVDTVNYGSMLATAWNPVKINPHGTIELRGMDMNFPSLLFCISVAVKHLFQDVYEHSLQVVPSDIGVAEYFKEEKGKLFVPPDEYVRKKLQYLSAYVGMESDFVRSYCKSFLKLAKTLVPNSSKKFLRPFEEMVETEHTVSDKILHQAIKLGYKQGEQLPDEIAQKLALTNASQFLDDLEKTQDLIEKHKNV